jgi:polyvinyl alcohol dehydrogenase (cytochrome)
VPLRGRTGINPKVALALSTVVALATAAQVLAGDATSDWATYGRDPANTRNQPYEHDISTANVARLAPKWVATTTGDVSATPAVVGGAVYFGDFGGTLWKLNAASGAVIWSDSIPVLTGLTGDFARSSPSVDGNVVVVGTFKRPTMLGINATTGALIWSTQVNPDNHGTQTGSPVLVGDTIITGTSAAGANTGTTSTFRTDLAALNALTGAILWQSYALPDNGGNAGGYAGATMFSAPTVDVGAGLVYGTFGNLYTEPASVAACNAAAPNGFLSEFCEQPGAYWDSIVAFNLATGAPVWSYRVVGDVPWHHACDSQPAAVTWCLPENDNPFAGLSHQSSGFGDDWDVGGASPNVFQINGRDVVGFGEKSGLYVVLDAKTGQFVWNTLVGPGGDQGGFEWGSAYDGNRIYVSLTDQHHIPYQLTENGVLTSTTATGGSWAALDPATGKILWQTADPQTESLGGNTVGVWDLGPATVANGVDYVSSMAKSGNEMYALDAATGKILWSFSAGSSVNAGPAIVNGSVYWGSGYSKSAEGSGNNKLYAFSIDGASDTTPPTTTITLSPSTPSGSNGWYTTPVGVTVSATDAGSGVFETRCVADPSAVPAGFADLPAGGCSLTTVAADGKHVVYAASEDSDNNAGSLVTSTFMIDQTAPKISAAATTVPNSNGWYSANVVVHFTCTDVGSGVPAGACPPDQVLSGIGTAISSTAETVTDAAGNVSAPSNVVTVKIVNRSRLCALTVDDVTGSSKYQELKPARKTEADVQTRLACSVLESSGQPAKRYEQVVAVLEQQGWLTPMQASLLTTLVHGL